MSFRVMRSQMNAQGKTVGIEKIIVDEPISYIPYRDTLVSQQTNQPIMIREENSGLTVVYPVDRIKEVVELEWQRIERQKVVTQQSDLAAAKIVAEEEANNTTDRATN